MQYLQIVIEISLQILFSWTIAFDLCLAFKLPARLIYIPFAILMAVLVYWFLPDWKNRLAKKEAEKGFILGVLVLGLCLGLLTLIVSRPNADDYDHFQPTLAQLQHLDQPFFTTDTMMNATGIPRTFIDYHHSYEHLAGMVATLLGADAISVHQNLVPFIACLLVTMTYALLYRRLGFKPYIALLAVFIAFVFLFIDGNVRRSFGNFGFVRLWQGKVLLVTVLIPIALMLIYDYLENPNLRRFGLVQMAVIGAAGLTTSGLFLVPPLIFAVSFAYTLNQGISKEKLKHAIIINLTSLYSLLILLGLIFGVLSSSNLTDVFASWPQQWLDSLLYSVLGSPGIIIRDLLILLLLPVLILPKAYARFLVLLTAALLLYTNPVTGPVLIKMLSPGSYWRLAYLFPVPLCAGLIAGILDKQRLATRQVVLRLVGIIIVLVSVILTYEHSVFTESSFDLKAPWEYRFSPNELAFSRTVSQRLQDKKLLASEYVAILVSMLNPSIRLETGRSERTMISFDLIGMHEEGIRRIIARNVVDNCQSIPGGDTALLKSINNGVNAIVVVDCSSTGSEPVIDLIKSAPGNWTEVERNHGYVLLMPQS